MTTPAPGKYTALCGQLWKEQRAQIEQIHYGASHGDSRSKALLAQIETYNAKLKHIEELGKFVASVESANADRN